MYLAHYDTDGTIKGFYIQEFHEDIPTPTLEITDEQHADFFSKGQNHRVIDGVWTYVEPPAPTTDEIQKQKLAALDAEYQPQFAQLAQALVLATLDGNQTVVDGIKTDYAALKAEYEKKQEAIING